MKHKFNIFLCLCLLLCWSCNKDYNNRMFMSTGKVVQEKRQLPPYNKVYLYDNISLTIDADIKDDALLEAGENLLPYMITEVKDCCLYVRNNNRFNWTRTYKTPVNLSLKNTQIKKIIYHGYGDITCVDTIALPHFQIDSYNASGTVRLLLNVDLANIHQHYGFSEIVAQGYASVSYVYNAGQAPFLLNDLQSDYVFLANNGNADIVVNAKVRLDARIESVGNVYYVETPAAAARTGVGEGELLKFDNSFQLAYP